MSKPLVSVVIPTYNGEETIVEALKSVSSQTHKPIELIVVNDGSTDNTAAVINNYHQRHLKNCQEEDPIEFRYMCQENGGPSKARNAGIRASKGEYIAFLDADDLWTHDKLEKQLKIFTRDPSIDIVFTDVRISRLRNNHIEEFTVFKKKNLDVRFFGHEYLVLNPLEKIMKLNFMPTPSVVAKRSCFVNGTHFNENRHRVEDWELWLTMSLRCTFGYVPDVCVHVKDFGDGLSFNETEMTLSATDVFDSFITTNRAMINQRKRENDRLAKCIKEEYKWMGYYLMRNGKNGLARSFYRKSMKEAFDLKTALYYLLSYFK